MTSKEIEDELDTMLDPYAIPAPWIIKYDRDDNLYYFNPETGGRKIYRPDDVSYPCRILLRCDTTLQFSVAVDSSCLLTVM